MSQGAIARHAVLKNMGPFDVEKVLTILRNIHLSSFRDWLTVMNLKCVPDDGNVWSERVTVEVDRCGRNKAKRMRIIYRPCEINENPTIIYEWGYEDEK